MKHAPQTRLATLAFGLLVAALVGVLAVAVCQFPEEPGGLSSEVAARLEGAGVSNPVTAVLLNFRGYDTLLELVVLLLAVLGAQVLAGGAADLSPKAAAKGSAGAALHPTPVLLGFVRLVAPAMVVVAGYILWVGGHAAGGAFQAGAVLAALGVLLLMAGGQNPRLSRAGALSSLAERSLLVAGAVVFFSVGIGTMLAQRRFLEYPVAEAKWLLVAIEAAATLSIAAILVALFRGGSLVTRQTIREETDGESPTDGEPPTDGEHRGEGKT